ncbi:MmgE/PrpD family protein, partial [Thermodesulfobacteriota bacterium]
MITEQIARFIHETSSTDIPPEALKTARLAITDFIGVALAGSGEEAGDIISGYAKATGGKELSGVIGKGFKVPPYLASLANGTIGHALDYDDFSFMFAGHSSVSLAPAILSVGESINASGTDVLDAYVIGFEAIVRISAGVAHKFTIQGWHTTNTIGSLAAAAAVTRLLKLEMHQIRMAFGVVASMAGGLRQNFGTMTKPLHAGISAANGVLAASLAQHGFTADENIIESPLGYARVFGCSEEIDWQKASADLGKSYAIVSPGINFKPYPSCGGTIGIIDAALHLKNQYEFNTSMIEEIVVGISPFELRNLIHHRPKTGLEGKFSLEYCACRALIDGKILLRSFTTDKVNEEQVQALIERTRYVECYETPILGAEGGGKLNPQSVTVKLK